MLVSNFELDKSLGDNGILMNPFGPNILHFNLNENILKKIIDIINNISTEEKEKVKDIKIVNSGYDLDIQKNSISSGEMLQISPEYDKKNNHFLGGLIYDITLEYYKSFIQQDHKDISLRHFKSSLPNEDEQMRDLNVGVKDIWYVKMKSGDFHIMHNHAQSADISGGIYLDVPTVPFPQSMVSWVVSGNNLGNFSSGGYGIQPQAGDVFVWPAWLSHHVYPFKNINEERPLLPKP